MLPNGLMKNLPESVQRWIKGGFYTLYSSKNGKTYFLETKKGQGYVLSPTGEYLAESTLDLDNYTRIPLFTYEDIVKMV